MLADVYWAPILDQALPILYDKDVVMKMKDTVCHEEPTFW